MASVNTDRKQREMCRKFEIRDGHPAQEAETILYFVRHAEDQIELVQSNELSPVFRRSCKPFVDGREVDECCSEVLNPLGERRAELLAKWFQDQGITDTLTNVIASHKIRTRQTIQMIASDAGLAGDVDQNPKDGVQQVPPFVDECASGFEGSSSSRDPMIKFLGLLPTGSVALVAAHSPTIYPIMESFGIDTSDPDTFPRSPRGRVSGFNNVWIVSVDSNGVGELVEHIVLDVDLVETPKN